MPETVAVDRLPLATPIDQRAREILAAQYQRDDHQRAESILMGFRDKRAVDAVLTALQSSSEQVRVLRELAHLFVSSLTNAGRNHAAWLSINHDELRVLIDRARQALKDTQP